ncbi:hypothetical protein F5Y16DRAFT_369570 [Xylariaceae sp. FL0255]|nr:hypothetical protein F5Y16DRAFT_369570 [Xylariaceae sp. FL0255]
MSGQPLKYTVTHHRKPEHTHEAFIKWITEEHIPLAMPILKKHGVLGYQLFVTPPGLNGAIKEQMIKMRPTWDFAEYDFVIEYTIPDMAAIGSVLQDPEWHAAVADQDQWVDTSKALVSVGYATPYLLQTGEIVNVPRKS